MCHKLKFQEASDHGTYLGLPNIIGRNKSSIFGYIKDNLHERIEGLDQKCCLNEAKKQRSASENSGSNFTMNVFLLPLDLCHDLEKLMCKFW